MVKLLVHKQYTNLLLFYDHKLFLLALSKYLKTLIIHCHWYKSVRIKIIVDFVNCFKTAKDDFVAVLKILSESPLDIHPVTVLSLVSAIAVYSRMIHLQQNIFRD